MFFFAWKSVAALVQQIQVAQHRRVSDAGLALKYRRLKVCAD
jgi:hypothetical protein